MGLPLESPSDALGQTRWNDSLVGSRPLRIVFFSGVECVHLDRSFIHAWLARKTRSGCKRLGIFGAACAFYGYNSWITRCPGYWLRTKYLRNVLRFRIGEGTAVHMGCFFTGRSIEIGDHSVVNRNCYLDGRGELYIGDNVSISPEVYILTATHDVDDTDFKVKVGSVRVENRVWIGARALVLPGVTLGEGSVVGAGAVVTRSTDAYSVVVGNPAREVRKRSPNLSYELRYFSYFNTDLGH